MFSTIQISFTVELQGKIWNWYVSCKTFSQRIFDEPFCDFIMTFLTWREPLNHWENPLQHLDNGFCQYLDHLRWNIQNVSHQSPDHPTPEGIRTQLFFIHSASQSIYLFHSELSIFILLVIFLPSVSLTPAASHDLSKKDLHMKLTWAGFVSIPASEPL